MQKRESCFVMYLLSHNKKEASGFLGIVLMFFNRVLSCMCAYFSKQHELIKENNSKNFSKATISGHVQVYLFNYKIEIKFLNNWNLLSMKPLVRKRVQYFVLIQLSRDFFLINFFLIITYAFDTGYEQTLFAKSNLELIKVNNNMYTPNPCGLEYWP